MEIRVYDVNTFHFMSITLSSFYEHIVQCSEPQLCTLSLDMMVEPCCECGIRQLLDAWERTCASNLSTPTLHCDSSGSHFSISYCSGMLLTRTTVGYVDNIMLNCFPHVRTLRSSERVRRRRLPLKEQHEVHVRAPFSGSRSSSAVPQRLR